MLRLHTLCHSNTSNLHIRFILSSKFLHSIMPNRLLLNTKPLLQSPSFVNGVQTHVKLLHTNTVTFCSNSAKPVTSVYPFSVKSFNLSYSTLHSIPGTEQPLEEPRTDFEAPFAESSHSALHLSRLMSKLAELRIEGYERKPGQYENLSCPMCKDVSVDKNSLNLNISADGNTAVWNCKNGNCGWEGNTMAIANVLPTYGKPDKIMKVKKIALTEKSLGLGPLSDDLIAFLGERLITPPTLRRNFVMQKYSGDKAAIAFTYRRDGVLVNCKYRDANKKFWQEQGCEKILYGLDDIKDASEIIIVEGEMDKLAMEEAGFLNCVSVPDGAPAKVSAKQLPSPDEDTKYAYLWNCEEYFRKASKIVLATDADQPGQALAEELARRLGRERCWRVKWPKKNEDDYLKDANDVLMYLGKGKLKETIENAELYPIQGLYTFRAYFHEIDAYYHRVRGDDELGVSTGWKCLDDYYNVVPGELTIVTGIPNSGKSEWIDSLLCNLNQKFGWKFVLCSMENKVREHARKLLEKKIKKPFFNVRYGETVERMTLAELEQGKEWLDNTFHLIRSENDSLPNIKWVIDLAKAAVLRHGVRGLVIDPYNELDHQRDPGMTETEYVSKMLTAVKRFAQHHSCHVWFVAHPRQLQSWNGDAPNLYDISGSAHFINKCDNGIVVHRNRDPAAGPIDRVQICVRKVRNKVCGTIGEAFLTYNRITGEYVDLGS